MSVCLTALSLIPHYSTKFLGPPRSAISHHLSPAYDLTPRVPTRRSTQQKPSLLSVRLTKPVRSRRGLRWSSRFSWSRCRIAFNPSLSRFQSCHKKGQTGEREAGFYSGMRHKCPKELPAPFPCVVLEIPDSAELSRDALSLCMTRAFE